MLQRRQICERAVFDRSSDDPRILMHRYQQRMRAQLLAKVAQEARREAWLTNFGGMLAAAAGEFARAIINPEQTPQRAVRSSASLRLVAARQAAF
jgi:hypothetical protein